MRCCRQYVGSLISGESLALLSSAFLSPYLEGGQQAWFLPACLHACLLASFLVGGGCIIDADLRGCLAVSDPIVRSFPAACCLSRVPSNAPAVAMHPFRAVSALHDVAVPTPYYTLWLIVLACAHCRECHQQRLVMCCRILEVAHGS
jgi:hypothetical protein